MVEMRPLLPALRIAVFVCLTLGAGRSFAGEVSPAIPSPEPGNPPSASAAGPRFVLPELHGFLETAGGARTQDDPNQPGAFDLGDFRWQLEAFKTLDGADFKYRGDILYDGALDKFDFDLREAHLAASPLASMDVKIGRQILTWGTGDLIFLNDLFPKDFQSFFIGRDEEYLKAPSDAIKTGFFTDYANLDLVWTPRFNPDRFVNGERLSFYNAILGRMAGDRGGISEIQRDRWAEDSELALRLFKNLGGYELALYGYYGYFKNPAGATSLGQVTFPRLAVYGASARGEFLKGVGNVEVAYYDSLDDRRGTDPLTDNGQLRFLAGYTREIATDLTAGVQYNLERMIDHENYANRLPEGSVRKIQDRQVTTLRLTRLALQQNLRLSLFVFYSPSDADAHLRPSVHYRIDDLWSVAAGSNIFLGEKNLTFFGQLEDNTNVYGRIRYSF
ncbi:MAG: hypothetical protein HY579_11280 [Nitrospinae bacterium]|nr:hypothetical protein [Nitrospinota bacterium]